MRRELIEEEEGARKGGFFTEILPPTNRVENLVSPCHTSTSALGMLIRRAPHWHVRGGGTALHRRRKSSALAGALDRASRVHPQDLLLRVASRLAEQPRETGGSALVRALVSSGVSRIFGIPGTHTVPIYEALEANASEIKHTLTRHEQGAGFAAEGE